MACPERPLVVLGPNAILFCSWQPTVQLCPSCLCFTIGCLHFHACLPVIDDCLLCCDPCLQLQALGLPRGSSNVT